MTTADEEFKHPREIAREALRAELNRLLALCTQPQQVFFARIFPDVSVLIEGDLQSAILLCQRTIRKNQSE